MTKQFFGKRTWQALSAIFAIHLAGILAWQDPTWGLYFLIATLIATFLISYRSLALGLLIAFGEIFVGGHGHLIDATIGGFSLSLRMIIFLAVMLAWGALVLQKKREFILLPVRDTPWLLLVGAVILGALVGMITNDPGLAIDDVNSFLIIAYLLPIISITWTHALRRELLQVLTAAVAWLVLATIGLSFIFTHFSGDVLDPVYTFVRDTRQFEVTFLTAPFPEDTRTSCSPPLLCESGDWYGYWFRIFTPNHFVVGVMLMMILTLGWFHYKRQRLPEVAQIAGALAAAALLLSYSRSLWLGLAAGIVTIKLSYWVDRRRHIAHFIRRGFLYLAMMIVGMLIAFGSVMLPFPTRPDLSDAAFYQTSSEVDRDAAVSSRWSMLDPIMLEIQTSPIIGSGFGEEVTFISDDPRVREQSETGEWTAYRFEWGWLDLWLKMGLLGLIAFGWYAVVMYRAIRFTARKHGHAWLPISLGAGLVILFITNIFTPYLNHPIGLGYMLFVIPFIDFAYPRSVPSLTVKTKPVIVPARASTLSASK